MVSFSADFRPWKLMWCSSETSVHIRSTRSYIPEIGSMTTSVRTSNPTQSWTVWTLPYPQGFGLPTIFPCRLFGVNILVRTVTHNKVRWVRGRIVEAEILTAEEIWRFHITKKDHSVIHNAKVLNLALCSLVGRGWNPRYTMWEQWISINKSAGPRCWTLMEYCIILCVGDFQCHRKPSERTFTVSVSYYFGRTK
jgi:hypothetical protein